MKTLIYVFVLTSCAVGMATPPTFADPWKDESGKFRERYKKWHKDRAEHIREWQKDRREAAREWEKDRREAAREWDKKHREWEKEQRERWREGRGAYYKGRPHVYYESYGPPPPLRYEYAPDAYIPYGAPYEPRYRWHRFDDDDFDEDDFDDDDDDGHWRHGGGYRFRAGYRQPYYGEGYGPYDGFYYNRGAEDD